MHRCFNINWYEIGAELACLSDIEQGEFFNGFAHELNGPSFNTHTNREEQILSIGKKLKPKYRELFKQYFPSLWYKDE